MLGEGGESRFETNINFFLEEFGVNVNTGLSFFIAYKLSFVINTLKRRFNMLVFLSKQFLTYRQGLFLDSCIIF